MSSTSTFIGFGEEAKVSSRVLKPPGGGSSISFGDDPIEVPKKTVAKPVEEPAPEAAAPAPVEEEAAATVATEASAEETPSNGTAAEEAAPEESPKATEEPKTNGTANEGAISNGSGRDGSYSNEKVEGDDFPKVSFETESQEQQVSETPSSPPSQNGHAEAAPSAPEPSVDATNDSAAEVASKTAEQNGDVTPTANGHSNGTLNGSAVVNGSDAAPTKGPVETVETKEANQEKPAAPVRSNSNEQQESSKLSAVRSMPSNHHMKSSIFIEEETHNFIAPPKKSEPSPVKEKHNPFQQERPQRVRQPPGGFSSQLW